VNNIVSSVSGQNIVGRTFEVLCQKDLRGKKEFFEKMANLFLRFFPMTDCVIRHSATRDRRTSIL